MKLQCLGKPSQTNKASDLVSNLINAGGPIGLFTKLNKQCLSQCPNMIENESSQATRVNNVVKNENKSTNIIKCVSSEP